MKKLLGRSKSGRKSPTPSEMSASGDYNPYTQYREVPEADPGRNPYALGSSTFNSAPSTSQYNAYANNPAASARSNQYAPQSKNPYENSGSSAGYETVDYGSSNPYAAHSTGQLNRKSSFESVASTVSAPSSSMTSPYAASNSTITNPPSYRSNYDNASVYSRYNDDDAASVVETRQQLFGGVKSKLKSKIMPQPSSNYDPSIMETEEERAQRYGGTESVYNGAGSIYAGSVYGGVEDHDQENDDAEIEALKEQMKYVKKESLSSAQSARRYAEEAEASGLRTLKMLGEQGDQISNAESSVAVTENNTKLAEDYARELKTLNRSMFAVHVSNPFNSRRRMQEKEKKIRDTFHGQQLQRESNRQLQYDAQQRVSAAMGNIPGERRRQLTETELKYREQMARQKADLAQSSKFQFEPDDEDFEVERDIDSTLDDISAAANRLNSMAKSINQELTSQNQRVDKLNKKTQEVEIGVHLNTSRLARIR